MPLNRGRTTRPPVPHGTTNWTGVLFGFLLASLAAFQQFKLPPMLPSMLAEFGYPKTLAGAFMSVYAVIGLAVSLALSGVMARLGTGYILGLAFLSAISGNLLALIVPEDAWVALGSRALEGFAFAVFAIAGPVYTNRHAGPGHLALAIALSAIWIPVGQIAANLLVPLAETGIGWRIGWLATAAATAMMAAWTLVIRLRGTADLDLRRRPSAGQSPLTGEERWALTLSALLFTLWSAQYFAYMTWLPQFLVEAHGLGPGMATVGYSIPVLTLIVVGLLSSRWIRRGAPVGPMLAGSMLLQAAVWWAMPWTEGLAIGIASLLLYGIGIGITPVCLFAMPSTILGSRRAGPGAFATIMTGRNLGVLIGPILLPQVLLLTGVWSASGPVFGFITTLDAIGGMLLALGLARMGRRGPD
jgi:predicted MFS family arabinose efflux permease